MDTQHLTDETLQGVAMKEIQDNSISKHLLGCSDCRVKVENYQQLMVDLKKVEPEHFEFNVSTLVMSRIEQYKNQESQEQEILFWGALIVLLIGISALAIPYFSRILTIFNIKPTFYILLVVGTGLATFLFLLTDLVLQYKEKEQLFFTNNLQPTS